MAQSFALKRHSGFSLLEVQVSVILAAAVFAGMALTLDGTAEQVKWFEARHTAAGTSAPVGLVAIDERAPTAARDTGGRYVVDVGKVVEDGDAYVVIVTRRPAQSGDCGYP